MPDLMVPDKMNLNTRINITENTRLRRKFSVQKERQWSGTEKTKHKKCMSRVQRGGHSKKNFTPGVMYENAVKEEWAWTQGSHYVASKL